MFNRLNLCVIVGLFYAVFFLSIPAIAQQGQQDSGKPGGVPVVSEKELDQAAQAYIKITEIGAEYREEIQGTVDQREIQELQMEANDKMVEAVQNEGLNVEQYNNIINTIQEDNDAIQVFMTKVRELN